MKRYDGKPSYFGEVPTLRKPRRVGQPQKGGPASRITSQYQGLDLLAELLNAPVSESSRLRLRLARATCEFRVERRGSWLRRERPIRRCVQSRRNGIR